MPRPLPDPCGGDAGQGPDLSQLARTGHARDIVKHPSDILRQCCAPAGQMHYDQLVSLAGDLLASLYQAGGRGLAAPQIGSAYRMFVMDPGWKENRPAPVVVIDPDIWPDGQTLETEHEQCLSIPGPGALVTRPARIRMDYFDLRGVRQTVHLDGIAARIAQHEADHLNGVLIVDIAQGETRVG